MSMAQLPEIALTHAALDVAAATARVTCPEAGGIAVFLGTTRAETGGAASGAGELLALDYHAYDEMALKELDKLLRQARERWPIARGIIWHRLGRVAVTEASVIVAISCPHRDAAFAACAWLMDELKKTAPIWKKEIYREATRWQKMEEKMTNDE
jgi:molybdopterin synthase catalytic subunit